MVRAAVFAPAAAVVAMAAAPAQAGTDAGPQAVLFTGSLKGVSLSAADLAHPTSRLPTASVSSADGLVSMTEGAANVSRARNGAEQAVATIGRGSVLAAAHTALPGSGQGVHGMAFSGIAAKCLTSADGTIAGSSTISGGELLGGSPSRVPVNPPANFRVSTGNPDLRLTLNKQIQDAAGGMTVSAVSVDGTAGGLPARDLGIAHCSPPAGGLTGRRDGAVSGTLSSGGGVFGGLTGTAGTPELPSRPVLPSSGNLPADPVALAGAGKDALPAGIGDTQAPSVPQPALPGQLLGGLPGLPVGRLPVKPG